MDATVSLEPVAAVLLAAGLSRRFEAASPKQLLILDGETLVHRALRCVLEAQDGDDGIICLVLGHAAEEIRAAVADLLVQAPQVICLHNANYALGQSTSVRRAVEHLQSPTQQRRARASGAYFLPIDQPRMEASLLRRLVAAHRRGDGKIIVPSCGQRRGSPVLFDRAYFPELMALEGDQGGRQILRRHRNQIHFLKLDNDLPLRDIDTLDDLETIKSPQGEPPSSTQP